MLNVILWMLAMALGTFIVGILLGPIPTITDPVCSRPKQVAAHALHGRQQNAFLGRGGFLHVH